MDYNIPIKEGGLYKAILMIMDPFLELTVGERHVLIEILKLENRVINSTTRQILKEVTGLKKHSFNNHLMRLKAKGIILEGKYRELYVNPRVIDMVSSNTLNIKFYVPKTT